MKNFLLNIINPVEWYKAWRFKKQIGRYDRSKHDLELELYSKILKNDMLHWGYFDQTEIKPEEISIAGVEQAQLNYANKIIRCISNQSLPILDSGCGMGGLTTLLKENGLHVEALTPNLAQKTYLRKKFPDLVLYHCKYQDLETSQKFGTIINSESLQYIPLDQAFETTNKFLLPDGIWIVSDYFRIHNEGINKSSHLLSDFYSKVASENWEIIHSEDMTMHILPTSRLINLYAERFLIPIKDFAFEKLKFKKPMLYYFAKPNLDKTEKKITKELAAIDPAKFINEKRYMLFVLKKGSRNTQS